MKSLSLRGNLGHNYTAHDYKGHQHIQPNYTGHSHIGHCYLGQSSKGHDRIGHGHIGQNCMGHEHVGTDTWSNPNSSSPTATASTVAVSFAEPASAALRMDMCTDM